MLNEVLVHDKCDCSMCQNKISIIDIKQCLDAHHKLSLDELVHFIDLSLNKCDQICDQIDASFTSSCSNEYPRTLITLLLKLYASHHPNDWYKYQYWNTNETYTRNLIAHHSNRFTLMLVCWKGGSSPIHNHAGSDCLMCIIRGTIRETKYHIPKDEHQIQDLSIKEILDLQEGEVHLINDDIGLHKMETLDENQQAITLHCYIPPYFDCFIFDKENNQIKTHIEHTTYDTEFGNIV